MHDGTPDWVYKTDWDLSKQYEDIDKNIKLGIEKQKELIHGYYACVSFIDHQIGLLITHLKELKLFDNTIIVICGDQGMHLGDHGVWSIKSNLEEATRTPLIISHSNQFIGKTNTPTELLDIFPTLCGMAGISSPEGLEGKSLLPVMKGIQKQNKPYALSQIQRLDDYMGYAFRDERYRYVVWMRNNFRSYYGFSEELIVASELYDYKADYAETVNLINRWEYMNVVQKFRNWSVDFFISQEKSHINMYHFLYD
jgi:iduronate 2-sulfatase